MTMVSTVESYNLHSSDPSRPTASSSTTTNIAPSPQSIQEQDEVDGQFPMLFCRALYNYEAQDPSALSFQQGDIIEVLSQQPSGWWDGLLGEDRGWFPSNYVQVLTEEEVDMAFSGSELSGTETTSRSVQDNGVVDMSQALMRGSQSENEEWLDNELSYRPGAHSNGQPAANSKSQPGDYWMPEITADNQIWYVNERTGQRARDIPLDYSEEETSDGDLAGLTSQSSSRSTTSVNLPFGINGSSEASGSTKARSTTTESAADRPTPEPWVRKVWNDGTSYYQNTVDGRTQWARPDTRDDSAPEGLTPKPFSEPPPQPGVGSRLSVYSDSSDVQPLDYLKPSQSRRQLPGNADAQPSNSTQAGILELTSAEKIAKTLQQALESPPPDVVTDLSSIAKNTIQAVIDNIQATGVTRQPDDFTLLDDLVSQVVVAVRNLLYVAAIPTGHIPSNVLPRGGRDAYNQSSQQSPLKPVQRKVTATLSRLVLSARAMQYDSGAQLTETLNRIESDAEELERAIASFVLEVQRAQHSSPNNGDIKSQKRLQAVFSVNNVGLGLVGAGSAASWKGFGWVSSENGGSAPRKALSIDVVSEIGTHLSQLQDTIAALNHALRISNDSAVEQVRQKVQRTVTQVSAFLNMIADVHIARHIDIDGIRQGEVATNDQYSQSVENARRLVRTLETVLQSLYDDTSALLLTTQNLHDTDAPSLPGEQESSYDLLDKLSTSLSSNLSSCRQTIEAILSVGHEQADMAQGDYTGSIEWRMSRLSVINSQFGAGGAFKSDDAYDSENEGVVDLEVAFHRPGARKKPSMHDSSYDTTLANGNGSYDRPPAPSEIESTFEQTLVSSEVPDDVDILDDDLDAPSKPLQKPAKSKDLGKIFGDEYVDKVAADSRPWYLQPNYRPEDIIIETDGSVRGGTVAALVERLTAHEQLTDRTYTEAFLMSFKSFATVDEVVDLLIARFRIQPPDNLTPEERDEWGRLKQRVIQIRVINTLKSIVTNDDIIEKEDLPVLDKIKDFISSDDVSAIPAAKQLLNLIERAQSGGDNVKTMVNTTTAPPPPPILPKNIKKLRFTDIEPLELARQLTIMESQLYQKIKPMECFQRAREQKMENMDNIAIVIQTSNKIADWVADLVLSKEDSRKRATVVKHLISVADRCRTLHNFSTMIAITSGLNTPPIRRLKRTWEQVSQRYMAQFGACEMTIDSNKNFTKYRQLMASVTPPCVPFIGVFLSTLQFIQDGNPDNLPGGLVNFRKRQKASEVISDIKRWQTQSFNLQPVPAVLNFIEESLNQFSDTRASSDHFWALSLEREPREREDEKMARLLQESGFL